MFQKRMQRAAMVLLVWRAVRVARGTMNINAGAQAARHMAKAEEQR